MKKALLPLFVLFFSAFSGNAQDKEVSTFEHKNIAKLNLSSLLSLNIMVQDEYTLSDHTSIALSVGYLPGFSVGSVVSVGDGESSSETSMSFSGFSITPEFRWYPGKRTPYGFYFAPYFRYAKYSSNLFDFTFDKSSGGQENIKMEGDYKNTTFGLMIGDQYRLSDHLSLDWWIVGIGFGTVEYSAKASGNFSQADIDDFNSSVDDTDIPFFSFSSYANANTAEMKVKMPLGFRGFGLCLGYKF